MLFFSRKVCVFRVCQESTFMTLFSFFFFFFFLTQPAFAIVTGKINQGSACRKKNVCPPEGASESQQQKNSARGSTMWRGSGLFLGGSGGGVTDPPQNLARCAGQPHPPVKNYVINEASATQERSSSCPSAVT